MLWRCIILGSNFGICNFTDMICKIIISWPKRGIKIIKGKNHCLEGISIILREKKWSKCTIITGHFATFVTIGLNIDDHMSSIKCYHVKRMCSDIWIKTTEILIPLQGDAFLTLSVYIAGETDWTCVQGQINTDGERKCQLIWKTWSMLKSSVA